MWVREVCHTGAELSRSEGLGGTNVEELCANIPHNKVHCDTDRADKAQNTEKGNDRREVLGRIQNTHVSAQPSPVVHRVPGDERELLLGSVADVD